MTLTQIWVPSNPRGAERLPPAIVAADSDFYLRRLWGLPSEVSLFFFTFICICLLFELLHEWSRIMSQSFHLELQVFLGFFVRLNLSLSSFFFKYEGQKECMKYRNLHFIEMRSKNKGNQMHSGQWKVISHYEKCEFINFV